jgi:hypothetical protein
MERIHVPTKSDKKPQNKNICIIPAANSPLSMRRPEKVSRIALLSPFFKKGISSDPVLFFHTWMWIVIPVRKIMKARVANT